jgi:hypothetical protein
VSGTEAVVGGVTERRDDADIAFGVAEREPNFPAGLDANATYNGPLLRDELQGRFGVQKEELVGPSARPPERPARSDLRCGAPIVGSRLPPNFQDDLTLNALHNAQQLAHWVECTCILGDRHDVSQTCSTRGGLKRGLQDGGRPDIAAGRAEVGPRGG